jgi:predicted ATP-grasp superfamily ATP-dependent carboligase
MYTVYNVANQADAQADANHTETEINQMKLVAGLLGVVLGYALGTGAATAGIVAIAGFSTPIFCALVLGAILAIAI